MHDGMIMYNPQIDTVNSHKNVHGSVISKISLPRRKKVDGARKCLWNGIKRVKARNQLRSKIASS